MEVDEEVGVEVLGLLGGWEVKALLGVLEVEVGEEVGVDSR